MNAQPDMRPQTIRPSSLFARLALVILLTACSKSAEPQASKANTAAIPAAATGTETATYFGDLDPTDTAEDPATTEAGEALAQAAARDIIGTAAPLAVMKTIDDDVIDLGKVYGDKPVYIKFWASWCAPCRQQMPAFQKLYESLGDEVEVVAINIGLSDDEASVRAFRQRYGLTMPIVFDDGHLAKLFHLSVTPQHVLIGRDMRFRHVGHAHNAALDRAIEQALAEPRPADAAPAVVAAERVIGIGDRVPPLSLTLLDGETQSLHAKPGRVLAVAFFSTWCEWYLERTRPSTSRACTRVREQIQSPASQPDAIDWLGIAGGLWSTEQDLVDYRAQHGMRIPLALDSSGTLFRTFGIRDVPTVVLIDDSGQLLRVIHADETDLAGALQSTIERRKPSN
jgi:thiol-disulfide isomerase/thioredoxin